MMNMSPKRGADVDSEAICQTREESNSIPAAETEKGRERMPHHSLDQEIAGMLFSSKRAYLDAVRLAPALVSAESDPIYFIRPDEADAFKNAAERLTGYWNIRSSLFGTDRVYLPLHQSGLGALDLDDIETLRSGVITILPGTADGRLVTCFDLRRISSEGATRRVLEIRSVLRVFFYMLNVIFAECSLCRSHEMAATFQRQQWLEPMSFLIILNNPCRGHKEKKHSTVSNELSSTWISNYKVLFEECLKIFKAIMPTEIHSLHVIAFCHQGVADDRHVQVDKESLSSNKGELPIIAEQLRGLTHHNTSVFVHMTRDAADIVKKLRKHKFYKRGLPVVLGGNWTDEMFRSWLRRRRRVEDQESTVSIEDRRQRKRTLNAIRSRQLRKHQKVELEVLQQHCNSLSSTNCELRSANARLGSLLRDAQKYLAAVTNQNSSEPFQVSEISPAQRVTFNLNREKVEAVPSEIGAEHCMVAGFQHHDTCHQSNSINLIQQTLGANLNCSDVPIFLKMAHQEHQKNPVMLQSFHSDRSYSSNSPSSGTMNFHQGKHTKFSQAPGMIKTAAISTGKERSDFVECDPCYHLSPNANAHYRVHADISNSAALTNLQMETTFRCLDFQTLPLTSAYERHLLDCSAAQVQQSCSSSLETIDYFSIPTPASASGSWKCSSAPKATDSIEDLLSHDVPLDESLFD